MRGFAVWAALAAFLAVGCGPKAGDGDSSTGGTGGPKVSSAEGESVDAQGSTFVQPFLSKVFSEYKTKTGFQINYTGGGSSAGIQGVVEGGAPFGASDAPMSDEEMGKAKGKILNVPIVLGAVAIAYNVPGVESGLKLDGPVLAEIFMSKIEKWNDPKIAGLNPGVTLPDLPIAVQVRADGSGTTYVVSDFLSKVSEEWKSAMGTSKKLSWGPKAQQWPKSDGVANNTKQTPGSITYVELTWAKKSGLSYAAVKNPDGQFVLPDAAGITAAAEGVSLPDDFRVSIVNAPGAKSYPISSFVFGLVPEDLTGNKFGKQVVEAIRYTITDGQAFAEELDYAKLPQGVVDKVTAALGGVKTQ